MKNIFKIFGLVLAFGVVATSCNEDTFLEKVNPNAISSDVFWLDEADANAALTTVYGALQFPAVNGLIVWGLDIRSDMLSTNNWTPWLTFKDLNVTDNNPNVTSAWAEPYIGVFRANQVINNVTEIDDAEFEENNKNVIIAQARFLRAYYYFKIVHNFGQAILTTSAEGLTEELHLELSTIDQVMDSVIVPDLQFAIGQLPMSWSGEDLGRATWGAAKSLLGKAYLFNNQFELAAAELKDVIDNGPYSLVSDPLDNFSHLTELNAESIFEVPYNEDFNSGVTNAFQVDNTPYNTSTETTNMPRQAAAEALGGYRSMFASYFIHELMLTDSVAGSNGHSARFNASIVPSNYEGLYYNKVPAEQADKPWSFGESAYIKKYTNWYWKESEDGQGRTSINVRIMRLAEVYLMYAEALLSQATPDVATAIDYIDMVRNRAGVVLLQDYIDANGTIPQLHVSKDAYGVRPEVSASAANVLTHLRMVERPIEMCFEGGRWNDLVRWGIVKDVLDANKAVEDIRIARYSTNSGSGDNQPPLYINGKFRLDYVNNANAYTSEAHDYLPIPTLEIQLNNGL
ncbi:RagB/SusD family nutrient uptake outer membrane protein [Reichenbachiella sp.]|uniref:RagB/SusD family nutrient uptake outer membrane protein n=1 Tax=Reichenbachiella sp. TaxID=2184521 RepID=UPI003BB0B391